MPIHEKSLIRPENLVTHEHLELEGVDTGARWDELALLSDKRAEDGCNVFADLHYLLALLNGGRRMGAGDGPSQRPDHAEGSDRARAGPVRDSAGPASPPVLSCASRQGRTGARGGTGASVTRSTPHPHRFPRHPPAARFLRLLRPGSGFAAG